MTLRTTFGVMAAAVRAAILVQVAPMHVLSSPATSVCTERTDDSGENAEAEDSTTAMLSAHTPTRW